MKRVAPLPPLHDDKRQSVNGETGITGKASKAASLFSSARTSDWATASLACRIERISLPITASPKGKPDQRLPIFTSQIIMGIALAHEEKNRQISQRAKGFNHVISKIE